MSSYKLTDNVIARIAQIVQEGILTGVDIVDIMRQIEVEPSADGEFVDLTPTYRENVRKQYEKMAREATELHNKREAHAKNLV